MFSLFAFVLSFCMTLIKLKCIWLSGPLYFGLDRRTIKQFKKEKSAIVLQIHHIEEETSSTTTFCYIYTSSVTAERFVGGSHSGVWWTKYCISLDFCTSLPAFYILQKAFQEIILHGIVVCQT